MQLIIKILWFQNLFVPYIQNNNKILRNLSKNEDL